MKNIFLSILFLLFVFNAKSSSVWNQKADFGAEGRHRGVGLSIGSRGYIGLGHYNGTGINIVKSDWWEYDPGTNTWTQKADFTGNNGSGNYGVIFFEMDDAGYICGGQQGSGNELIKYNPSTNTWTTVASPPFSISNNEGFTIGNIGYVISSSQLWRYDSFSNLWSSLGPTPFGLSAWNSGFSMNGTGYIKTGNAFWEYKPTLNLWLQRANFPGLATGGSVALVQNGKGYIVGGYGSFLANVNSEVWEFNPGTNSWLLLSNFIGTSRRFAAGFNINDVSYMGTGTNGTNFSDFWEFNLIAGVNDLIYDTDFTTFPNPATTHVNFKSGEYENGEITIYSMNGDLIRTLNLSNSKTTLYRENLSAGIYYYNVMVDDQLIYSNKFIFR